MKKFELTVEKKINWFGRELYRIRALISFETASGEIVNVGDLGGFVESEKNLSHEEKAWISGNAEVWGNAEVCDDATVFSTEHILNITPIGANTNSLTFFRTKTREIGVSFKWDFYSLEGFESLIENWIDKFKITARMAIEIAKVHINLTDEVPFGKCSNCGEEFNSELVNEYEITHCPWCGTEVEG